MTDSSPAEGADHQVDYDVIIVGAGISGLTAADELLRSAPDLKILILEAKNRVGGRTCTIQMMGKHQQMDSFDLGGQWVGRNQKYILEMIKDLELETHEQYTNGKNLAQMGMSKIRSYNESLPITSFRFFEIMDLVTNITKVERLRTKVNLLNVFSWPRAPYFDEMTISKWTTENFWSRSGKDVMDIMTRALYGVESNKVNMLFHLYCAQAAGSFQNLLETVGDGAQAMTVKGGTQQISEKLAKPFRTNKTLMLKKAVAQIDVDEHTMSVTVNAYDNVPGKSKTRIELTSYTAHRVILAIPPNQCSKIDFEPALPSMKKKLFDTFVPGNYIKFVITYQTPFWREKGFSGEIISTGSTTEKDEVLPIVFTFDCCTPKGTPALVGVINNYYSDHTKAERCNMVVEDLIRFFGKKAMNEFIAYEEKIWANEEFNGGCPMCYAAPGQLDVFQTIRDPYHSVHFAGTETATRWMGYMDGAVQAGKRAAHEVLHMLGRDDVINSNYLTDSVYAMDYNPPIAPSNEYIEVRSPWWHRLFMASAIIFGIWAFSKKYQLSRTAKVFRPAEKAAIRWLFNSPWPSR